MHVIFFVLLLASVVSQTVAASHIINGTSSHSAKTPVITYPNLSEKFLAGNDVVIRWEGVELQDTVELSYSTDGGTQWNIITQKAVGLQHTWRVPNIETKNCLLRIQLLNLWPRNVIPTRDPLSDAAQAVVTDAFGNVYVTGMFDSEELDFGHDIVLKNSYQQNIFIAKYNPYGRCLWAKNVNGNDLAVRAMQIDIEGNIYIGGSFGYRTLDFGYGVEITGINILKEGFLAKYSTDGKPLWARAVKGLKDESVSAIAVDRSMNIFVCGVFDSPGIDLGEGTGLENRGSDTVQGGMQGFLARYDSSGRVLWAKTARGDYDDYFTTVAIDSKGYIFLGGYSKSLLLNFGQGVTVSSTDRWNQHGFIAKYDKTGNIYWAQKAGQGTLDMVNQIVCDTYGNLYISGTFAGSQGLDLGNGINITGQSDYDSYIAKFDNQLRALWAKKLGYTVLSINRLGELSIAGTFTTTTLDFGNGISLVNSSSGQDCYIARMDGNGSTRWARRLGGTRSEFTRSVTTDIHGNIFSCGFYQSPQFMLDGGATLTNPSNFDSRIFIAKYQEDGSLVHIDVADEKHSIVKPTAVSHPIDLGEIKINTKKVVVVHDAIRNNGQYPIRIDAITITGAHASEFNVEHDALPFTIGVGEQKALTFTFTPAKSGLRTSTLTITTQADKLVQTVSGIGVFTVINTPAVHGERTITVSPHPVHDVSEVTISIPEDKINSIILLDPTGKEYNSIEYDSFMENLRTVKIRAKDLPSGLYFLRICTATQVITRSILIHH